MVSIRHFDCIMMSILLVLMMTSVFVCVSAIRLSTEELVESQVLLKSLCSEHPHCYSSKLNALTGSKTSLCSATTNQCEKTACKTVCLSDLVTVSISVDCSKAPGWKMCEQFRFQVKQAESMLSAQLKARVCERVGACRAPPSSEFLLHWIDDNSGDEFPTRQESRLPIESCRNVPREHKLAPMLCRACEQVVTADLTLHDSCVVMFKSKIMKDMRIDDDVAHKTTAVLSQRCEVVRDLIRSVHTEVLKDINSRICSCLGCCGDGQCFFKTGDDHLFIE